jgi:repressor LexA
MKADLAGVISVEVQSVLEQRIREAFNNQPTKEIANKLGLSYHAVRNYLRGRIPSGVKLIEISQLTGCSIHWLLTGEGEKRVAGPSASEIPVNLAPHVKDRLSGLAAQTGREISEQAAELIIEGLISRGVLANQPQSLEFVCFSDAAPPMRTVPLIGEIEPENSIQELSRPEEVKIAEGFFTLGQSPFALRVKGESLTDEDVFSGDIIICDQPITTPNGQPVVALIDNKKAVIKRIYNVGDHIILRPLKHLKPESVLTRDAVKVQGIVIGIQRPSSVLDVNQS